MKFVIKWVLQHCFKVAKRVRKCNCIRDVITLSIQAVSQSVFFWRRGCENYPKNFSIIRESKYCLLNVQDGSEHSTCRALLREDFMQLALIWRHLDTSRSRVVNVVFFAWNQ